MAAEHRTRISRREFLQRGATFALLPGLYSLNGAATAQESRVIAATAYGKVRGIELGGSNIFKGVPYARTLRRLDPPAPPEAWSDVRAALEFGPRALQVAANTSGMSESCQTLNVWTPELNRGKRPVMVWLHGGGFMNGSANTPLYDGTDLNREGDVVVVTLNHRLGAFGYLQIDKEGASGCAGMLDIVAALRWVRDNIAQFGGDPANVTLFGESGGGGKVIALMAMPQAAGLFHRAIVQSGALLRTAIEPAEGNALAHEVLQQLGLAPAQWREFLDAPAERVLQAQAVVLSRMGTPGSGGSVAQRPFSPVLGAELPEQPFGTRAPKISANVPLMIGYNKEETRFFFVGTPALYSLDPGELRSRLEPLLKEQTGTVLDAYRKTRPNATATELFFAITTAQMYGYTSTRVALMKSQSRAAPAYMYQYAYEGTQTAGNPPVAIKSGHSMEIPFVFAHPRADSQATVPEHERLLSKRMSQAWISFARTGDPNHSGLPKWLPYEGSKRRTMVFDRECAVVERPLEAERALWERLLEKNSEGLTRRKAE